MCSIQSRAPQVKKKKKVFWHNLPFETTQGHKDKCYMAIRFVCFKCIYFGLEHGNDFLWGDYQRRHTLHTSLFHRLYGCQVIHMENDQMTPLFIVKIPCLYAPLQTVITFHYNSAGQTPTFTNGDRRTGTL